MPVAPEQIWSGVSYSSFSLSYLLSDLCCFSVPHWLLDKTFDFVTLLTFSFAAFSFAVPISFADHTHLPKKSDLVTHLTAC